MYSMLHFTQQIYQVINKLHQQCLHSSCRGPTVGLLGWLAYRG